MSLIENDKILVSARQIKSERLKALTITWTVLASNHIITII